MALSLIKRDMIVDDAITSAKIDDETIVPADVVAGQVMNVKVNSSAAIATSKLSGAVTSIASHGVGPVGFLNAGTSANNIVQLDGTPKLPAVSGTNLTNLAAANFAGTLPAVSGTNLTNLTAANLTGTLPAISGTNLTNLTSANLVGALPALNASALTNLTSANLTGTLSAINGSALTNLDASDLSGNLPAIDGSNLTNLVEVDTSEIEHNIALVAFKAQAVGNLAKFNLVDQVVEEFKDDDGVTLSTAGFVGTTATDGYLATVVAASGVDSYTKLMMHMDDAGLTDSSATGHTVDRYGSITRSSTQSKFGGYAAYYDAPSAGTGGTKYWYIDDHAEFTLGNGDFTIDFWFRGNYTVPGNAGSVLETDNDAFNCGYVNPSGVLYFFATDTPWQWTIANSKSMGQSNPSGFSHHAVCRNGNSWYTFKDGVQQTTWTHSGTLLDGTRLESGKRGGQYLSGYVDELRFSVGIARWTSNFTPPTAPYASGATHAAGTATSTANTAVSAPTTADVVMLIENASGTATLNTDIKAYVSRNGGSGWDQATLVDKGSWGTNKKMLVANNVAFSNSASGTDMRYKIEWANQSSGSKETRVHALSLGWA